jgi:single-strand DNA-binding protein
VNVIFLGGRLGNDPEVKYTPNGQPVMSFSLAVDDSYKNGSGQKVERVTWFRCQIWGQRAESLSKYLHKGDQVFVNGRFSAREWEAKDGSGKRTSLEVNVFNLDFGAKGKGGGAPTDMRTEPQEVLVEVLMWKA